MHEIADIRSANDEVCLLPLLRSQQEPLSNPKMTSAKKVEEANPLTLKT